MENLETTVKNNILIETIGWNLVASSYSGNINDINNIISTTESIYKYDRINNEYLVVSDNQINAGDGYWIYADNTGYINIDI
jgi:hypothetical protein